MKISLEGYDTNDPEIRAFVEIFDEPVGSRILEIGAHDAPIASIMSKAGFDVTGVDLNECDQEPNYRHLAGDFCKMPDFMKENYGKFDCVVAVSSIEHFGFHSFGEDKNRPFYDVTAMRYIYDLLRPEGRCYLIVPFGGEYVEVRPHWRVYDFGAFCSRLVQDFAIEYYHLEVTEPTTIFNILRDENEKIDLYAALFNQNGLPSISICSKLLKRV